MRDVYIVDYFFVENRNNEDLKKNSDNCFRRTLKKCIDMQEVGSIKMFGLI